VAASLGVPPLLGVLAGSVTLAGGPATGLAFAPLFEQAGVKGAATLAVASAMVGIVSGGIIGGPIGTFLIERRGLRPTARIPSAAPPVAATAADAVLALEAPDPVPPALAGEDPGHGPAQGRGEPARGHGGGSGSAPASPLSASLSPPTSGRCSPRPRCAISTT
jgi:hypothetical protein